MMKGRPTWGAEAKMACQLFSNACFTKYLSGWIINFNAIFLDLLRGLSPSIFWTKCIRLATLGLMHLCTKTIEYSLLWGFSFKLNCISIVKSFSLKVAKYKYTFWIIVLILTCDFRHWSENFGILLDPLKVFNTHKTLSFFQIFDFDIITWPPTLPLFVPPTQANVEIESC